MEDHACRVEGSVRARATACWLTRARLGIGPPLTKGADADAMLGLWVAGYLGAARVHRPGLSPLKRRLLGLSRLQDALTSGGGVATTEQSRCLTFRRTIG